MQEKSSRILLFTTAFRPLVGGSELAIEEVARRLPNIYFDVLTPRLKKSSAGEEKSDNLAIYRLGLGSVIDKYFFPVLGFLKALVLNNKFNYKVIHGYQASYGSGAAFLLKTINPKIKFILTLQEGKDLVGQNFFIRFFRKMIIKRADLITAISSYLQDFAGNFTDKSKILVIPNGVDAEQFKISSFKFQDLENLKTRLHIKNDERVIITVSRLVPKNGLSDLIKALKLVIDSGFNAKLLIVGKGYLEKKLKTETEKLGLSSKVIFIGGVSHEDILNYLSISDVFVRPSRSEGLGNAFLEAMAAGLPIVGTNVGGIPDFLEDGITGLFCTFDPNNIASKIKLVLNDNRIRQNIVANALRLVKEKYSWDIIANQYRDLYNRFL